MSVQYATNAMRRARHVLRSPKGYMLILVGAIAVLGTASAGLDVTGGGLAAGASAAVAADLLGRQLTGRPGEFPSGALLTGLVVALVLDPYAPAFVAAVAAAAGVASKYLIRTGPANVLNPAAAGLVAVHLVLGHGESWWGGLPAYGVVGLVLVLVPGAWIADHINRLPLVLAFLATYFGLFTATAFGPHAIEVAEIFRAPGVHMAVFFAFYMLDDPPTSPTRYVDQIWYGVLVAALAYVLFMTTGVVYFLAAALLIGNLVNNARRYRQAHLRHGVRRLDLTLRGVISRLKSTWSPTASPHSGRHACTPRHAGDPASR